jgi:hypothetical protein
MRPKAIRTAARATNAPDVTKYWAIHKTGSDDNADSPDRGDAETERERESLHHAPPAPIPVGLDQ